MANVNTIFSIPKYQERNSLLSILRWFLAGYVLFVHSVPWYSFYGRDIADYLVRINSILSKVFQSSGETCPAVIAFITISGFCIHRNGMRKNAYDLKKYLLRRLFRIFPLLILGTLVSCLVFSLLGNDPKIIGITATNNITVLGLIYKFSGIFAFFPKHYSSLAYQANAPLVTCIVEVWLYISYAVIAKIVLARGDRFLWVTLACVASIGIVFCTIFPKWQNWWHNGSFFGFLIYWWIGVYSLNKANTFFNKFKTFMFLYVLLSLILLFLCPKIFILVEARKILLALLVASLLRWISDRNFGISIQSFFESGFSMYCLHVPLLCICLVYSVNFYLAFFGILVISYLSYVYIEEPLINLGRLKITRGASLQENGLINQL